MCGWQAGAGELQAVELGVDARAVVCDETHGVSLLRVGSIVQDVVELVRRDQRRGLSKYAPQGSKCKPEQCFPLFHSMEVAGKKS